MKTYRLFGLILLTFLLLPICFLNASWTESSYSGDWEYHNADSWKSPYNYTTSESFWNYGNVSNFQKMEYTIELLEYDVGGYWEISYGSQYHNITLVGSNGKKLTVEVIHEVRIHFFGYKDVRTAVSVIFDGEQEPILPVLRWMDVSVWIWKNASNIIKVKWCMKYDYHDEDATYWQEYSYDVGSDFFNNVAIYQLYAKGVVAGAGVYIKGQKVGEVISSGDPIGDPSSFGELTLAEQIGQEIWRGLGGIKDAIYNALPESVRNFLDQAGQIIYSFGSFLWIMINTLWNVLISNLPLIFTAYGLYLLYLIFKSIDSGDFSPLFEHFMKIGNFFFTIGNTILSVIRTIINLIKWW